MSLLRPDVIKQHKPNLLFNLQNTKKWDTMPKGSQFRDREHMSELIYLIIDTLKFYHCPIQHLPIGSSHAT